MPALDNPRWERFAQAIVEGLANGESKPYSQSRAYIAAGYTARDNDRNHRSAQAAASRLLSRVIQRVRELQAQAAERTQETAEKCVQELNQLRRDAHADKAYGAAVAAVMGKAKILNLRVDEPPNTSVDFSSAKSMQDVGRKLLQSVGFASPDDASIQAAIEANDAFIDRLQAIRDAAQGLTIDQDD
jgi:Terminase small subunit